MTKNTKESENRKYVANEIVRIFRILKISIIIGLVWFIGFSIYNKLFQYILTDYHIGWAESEKILGYRPSQYNFVIDKSSKKSTSNISDEKFLKELDSLYYSQTKKEAKVIHSNDVNNLVKNNAFDNEIHTGSMKITEEGRLEVKEEIISKLFENSIIFTMIMIGVTFILLTLFHYLNKAINWTKKYAD
jgi:hypothetical protein